MGCIIAECKKGITVTVWNYVGGKFGHHNLALTMRMLVLLVVSMM